MVIPQEATYHIGQSQTTMNPKVSVILPVYNGALTIERAMRSVLGQTFQDFEILVINDGSRDGTQRVVEEIAIQDGRIILLNQEKNFGLQVSLNVGITRARGAYIARIDADDAWGDPEKLVRQVQFMDEHPNHVLLGTNAIVVDEGDQELFRVENPQTDAEIRHCLLARNVFLHSSVMIRNSALSKTGGYDESAASKHIEDYDLWLRLGRIGKIANLPLFGIRYTHSVFQLSSKYRVEQYLKQQTLIKK